VRIKGGGGGVDDGVEEGVPEQVEGIARVGAGRDFLDNEGCCSIYRWRGKLRGGM